MNYQHHYNLLIERQKNRLLEGYKERHHIVPKCLGGKDVPENLVDLTAREHFVQHQLLAKIYPEHSGLQLAVHLMTTNGIGQERTENRRYQWVRERHQKQMSELMSGEGNSQFGTKWVHKGTESKKVPKDSLKQWLDDGWEPGYGRNQTKYESLRNVCKVCQAVCSKIGQETCSRECKGVITRKEGYELAKRLYEEFLQSGCDSIGEFQKTINSSQPRLSILWKKHLPEYRESQKQGKSYRA